MPYLSIKTNAEFRPSASTLNLAAPNATFGAGIAPHFNNLFIAAEL